MKLKDASGNLPADVTFDSADDDLCAGCRFTGYLVNRRSMGKKFFETKNCFKTESGLAKVR